MAGIAINCMFTHCSHNYYFYCSLLFAPLCGGLLATFIAVPMIAVALAEVFLLQVLQAGADPGRGLWGLKPPPSKSMIFITLFCRPISSQVCQVLLHPVIAMFTKQSRSSVSLFGG